MCYRFPYVGADLPKLANQPGIQRTLRDHGYGLVYHAICLFTLSLLSLDTHSSLTTEDRLRLSSPRFLRQTHLILLLVIELKRSGLVLLTTDYC